MGKHKSSKQDKIFLDFMTDHPDLARGFCKGDKVAQEELWLELSNKLNSEGPPLKDISGWKKAWVDWKGNIRRKLAHNKMEVHGTGGGNFNQFVLSQIEQQIAVLCGLFRAVDGIENAQSFGVLNITTSNKIKESASSSSASSPDLSPQPTRVKKRKQNSSLERFMDKKAKHLGAIRLELEKMCANNKMEEVANKLEDIDGKLNKILEIKKEKLDEIKKDNQERKRHNKEIEKHNSLMLKTSMEMFKLNSKR